MAATLEQQTQDALNESRILVLGIQVLLSFQYTCVLEPAFDALPRMSRYLELVALLLLMIAFGLFVAPAPVQLMVCENDHGETLKPFVTMVVSIALLPFAAALAIDIYIAAAPSLGATAGVILAGAIFGCAMFFWYVLESIHCRDQTGSGWIRGPSVPVQAGTQDIMNTEKRIQFVLTDARLVLPGAQALLGFQLVAVLLGGFDGLPNSSQYVHIASLTLVTLSTILLMVPPAYHRLVEQGEPSERFYRLAKTVVLASMIPLAAGICGDFFLVVRKISGSLQVASCAAILLLVSFYCLWFAFGFFVRGTSTIDATYRRENTRLENS